MFLKYTVRFRKVFHGQKHEKVYVNVDPWSFRFFFMVHFILEGE
jgi:hypothetical protein